MDTYIFVSSLYSFILIEVYVRKVVELCIKNIICRCEIKNKEIFAQSFFDGRVIYIQ